MRRVWRGVVGVGWQIGATLVVAGAADVEWAGSACCRECHPVFHERWATSAHGRSLRPASEGLARGDFEAGPSEVTQGSYRYRVRWEAGGARLETAGPEGEATYRIDHTLGGRDVVYVLSRLRPEQLQVLPVAYDRNRREWFHAPTSAVMHGHPGRAEAVDWTSSAYTFDQSCYRCHVSRVQASERAPDRAIRVEWQESGISCESCHGSAAAHVRACREAAPGVPTDLRIQRAGGLAPERQDSLCGSCHARATPLTPAFVPGERFLDHFDPVGWDDAEFYPDGRERGEAYTFTSWIANRCRERGRLTCLHCHTSSGRDRFPGAEANAACLPCHAARVSEAAAHSRHPPGSTGSRCVACHMPETEFARMRRHDHSFRPPTPASTLRWGSPNACTLCHTNETAAWADARVRQWFGDERQDQVLREAAWVASAQRGVSRVTPEEWARWRRETPDTMVLASLVRGLGEGMDPDRMDLLCSAARQEDPLVRARAVEGLATGGALRLVPLAQALHDDYRLVRVRAAAAFPGWARSTLSAEDRAALDVAERELEMGLRLDGDDAPARVTLGHYLLERGRAWEAAMAFEDAARLAPGTAEPWISAGTAWYRAGDGDRSESALRRALVLGPTNVSAWFNLAVVLEERGERAKGEAVRRQAATRLSPEAATEFEARWEGWWQRRSVGRDGGVNGSTSLGR